MQATGNDTSYSFNSLLTTQMQKLKKTPRLHLDYWILSVLLNLHHKQFSCLWCRVWPQNWHIRHYFGNLFSCKLMKNQINKEADVHCVQTPINTFHRPKTSQRRCTLLTFDKAIHSLLSTHTKKYPHEKKKGKPITSLCGWIYKANRNTSFQWLYSRVSQSAFRLQTQEQKPTDSAQ